MMTTTDNPSKCAFLNEIIFLALFLVVRLSKTKLGRSKKFSDKKNLILSDLFFKRRKSLTGDTLIYNVCLNQKYQE